MSKTIDRSKLDPAGLERVPNYDMSLPERILNRRYNVYYSDYWLLKTIIDSYVKYYKGMDLSGPLPPDVTPEFRDVYYLRMSWESRVKGEHYKTSVERVVEMAKRLRDLEEDLIPEDGGDHG